jgi:hypothetical protein
MNRRIPRLATALAAAVLATLSPGVARASSTQESMFQDDDHLIYASTATVNHVLDVLQSLGVDRVRVTIKWSAIAPKPASETRPANFNATDPNAYPAANWVPYDRVLRLALAHGIGVNFNVTAPGPLWAMRHGAPVAAEADHFAPTVAEFQQFVSALGVRYSGTFVPPPPPPTTKKPPSPPIVTVPLPLPVTGITSTSSPDAGTAQAAADPATTALPQVHYWTIWNEPNIDGWLAPQWHRVNGHTTPNSPRLYRQYADAAYAALAATGHTLATNTILIGETAPEGHTHPTSYPEMAPMPFLRALYCVNGDYHRLRGSAAAALGCPASGSPRAFVAAHPILFSATGWAHHPYFFFLPPATISDNTAFVPIADLSRLEGGLDRINRVYAVHRRDPLYLTEYGYQTNPPDVFQLVSPALQASYLNQADYMAYRDPRVKSVSQFLLYDSPPDARFAQGNFNYWDTFQTGLVYANGKMKPAFGAYRLPIWTRSSFRFGGRLAVWGQLRPAANHSAQTARVQWSVSHGHWTTIATVHVPSSSARGYFSIAVRPPGSGLLRISWQPPHDATIVSRSAAIVAR